MAAHLGTHSLALSSGWFVQPGSDSGWNRRFTLNRFREILNDTDYILNMSSGSAERIFTLSMPANAFNSFRSSVHCEILEFEDWDGDTREVFVQTVRRENGSRPFRAYVSIELVEV